MQMSSTVPVSGFAHDDEDGMREALNAALGPYELPIGVDYELAGDDLTSYVNGEPAKGWTVLRTYTPSMGVNR